ncbi:MAG: RecB family exonuclease [Dermatophilaceae bacterium]|nr:PD-(D/E)XK nuclease family protein [Intrasporangiaceae bacterium]
MPPALSPSRTADFKQCPLLYRFRAVDRLSGPPSPAAARGTLVHAVLEALFDLPASERTPDRALELVEPRWRVLVGKEPQLAEMLVGDGVTDATWFAQAGALVERWFELEDPTRLEPTDRELYVETEIDGLTLRGYIDRLDVAPTGEVRIVDYKTGRCPDERFESKALFQMKFYALVLWRLRGVVPDLLQLVYLGDGRIMRYVADETELLAIERNVQAVWSAIERAALTGDWRPRTSSLCSWCEFQSLCPEYGGTPPPLPVDAASIALDPAASGATAAAEDGLCTPTASGD